jgi:DNA-directed RNA polymerase specialized sigma24 family protein
LAEDFTQDVFIRVHEGLGKFEGRSKLSTWINKIATNITNDYFKSVSFQKGKKWKMVAIFRMKKMVFPVMKNNN